MKAGQEKLFNTATTFGADARPDQPTEDTKTIPGTAMTPNSRMSSHTPGGQHRKEERNGKLNSGLVDSSSVGIKIIGDDLLDLAKTEHNQ